jgi:hypothetical protein
VGVQVDGLIWERSDGAVVGLKPRVRSSHGHSSSLTRSGATLPFQCVGVQQMATGLAVVGLDVTGSVRPVLGLDRHHEEGTSGWKEPSTHSSLRSSTSSTPSHSSAQIWPRTVVAVLRVLGKLAEFSARAVHLECLAVEGTKQARAGTLLVQPSHCFLSAKQPLQSADLAAPVPDHAVDQIQPLTGSYLISTVAWKSAAVCCLLSTTWQG